MHADAPVIARDGRQQRAHLEFRAAHDLIQGEARVLASAPRQNHRFSGRSEFGHGTDAIRDFQTQYVSESKAPRSNTIPSEEPVNWKLPPRRTGATLRPLRPRTN